ncbi:MAG: hypothetical protein V3W05_02860 [candidate division NC10 bacterium]
MRDIDPSLIDDTWRRIREYDSATAVTEAQHFAREQPAVLHFTLEFLREFDEGTRGTALGLVYLLFRAAEAARRVPLPSLSPEQIEERYTINTEWLDAMERMESAPLERWQDHLPRSPVALYILQAYGPPLQKQGPSERRGQSHLLVLLMTLLETLESEEGREPSGEQ